MPATTIPTFRSRNRVTSVDALRGVAALAVTWYHFTQGAAHFLPAGPLKSSGTYGWLGVEVFFVISGFVIPYSLWRSRYQLRNFGRFVWKRIVRLDPPYFAAIALILALGWLSAHTPGYRGAPFTVSWTTVALHVGYLNAVVGGESGLHPWLNPVFWTLAIEFQFYLSIGVLYPIFAARRHRRLALLVSAACLGLTAIVPSPAIVTHYTPLFLTGVALFQYRAGVITAPAATFAVLILALAAAVLLGVPIAVVGLATAFSIVAFNTTDGVVHRFLSFLGGLSYSLYLLHVPIGGRIINLGERYAESGPARCAVLAAAVGGSIAAAWVFAWLIEHPAQRCASKLRLTRYVTPAGGRTHGGQRPDAGALQPDSARASRSRLNSRGNRSDRAPRPYRSQRR